MVCDDDLFSIFMSSIRLNDEVLPVKMIQEIKDTRLILKKISQNLKRIRQTLVQKNKSLLNIINDYIISLEVVWIILKI